MAWTREMPGVFKVTVEDNSTKIDVAIEKPLVHYQALQLADALTRAGYEISYLRRGRQAAKPKKK